MLRSCADRVIRQTSSWSCCFSERLAGPKRASYDHSSARMEDTDLSRSKILPSNDSKGLQTRQSLATSTLYSIPYINTKGTNATSGSPYNARVIESFGTI